MVSQNWISSVTTNLISTGIALAVLIPFYLIGMYYTRRHLSDEYNKPRIEARLYYTLLIVMMITLAKIWFQGFGYLVTVLSVMSAGLVIANKEFILNIVGWFIINWRSLFAEKDHVQIANHAGFVYEIGLLYFKLFETSHASNHRSSGKMIKVPNGLVIHHPVTNFSSMTNILEYEQHWIVSFKSDLEETKHFIEDTAKTVIQDYYKGSKLFSTESLKKRNKMLASFIDMKVHIRTTLAQAKPSGVKFILSYYCFAKDQENIHELIMMQILTSIKNNPNIILSFEANGNS